MQIKFVTRSGGNQFTGSGYYYYRTDKLNANTWLNNRAEIDKTRLRQKQMGVRAGGPILIPGLFDGRNKAFFFVNYEEVPSPGGVSRDRNILNPLAQRGIFTYIPTGGAAQQVDLLALAAANGVTSTPDPLVANLLRDIRSSTSGGSVQPIDANLDRLRYNSNFDSVVTLPNDTHRLQHHREAPLQQLVQLPALQYQPRHAEQPRCTVSRISSRGQPGLGALCDHQFASLNAKLEHRQRSIGRVEWSAGHLLQRVHRRHVGRDLRRRSGRLSDPLPHHGGHESGQRVRPGHPVVAKRFNHADRGQLIVAPR